MIYVAECLVKLIQAPLSSSLRDGALENNVTMRMDDGRGRGRGTGGCYLCGDGTSLLLRK